MVAFLFALPRNCHPERSPLRFAASPIARQAHSGAAVGSRSARARYGLLAGDYNAIEIYGRELVKTDPKSGPGHIYLGEAALGKDQFDNALREFVTARALYKRQNPDAVEQPVSGSAHQSVAQGEAGAKQRLKPTLTMGPDCGSVGK